MKNKIAILFVFVMLILTAGCAQRPSGSKEIFSEDYNYPVEVCGITLESAPKRVVVLSPSLAEIISDMGFSDTLVGRSKECDYPETVSQLTATGSVLLPDIDEITKLKPDLLLVQTQPSDSISKLFKEKNIPVIVVPAARRFEELQTVYTNIGKIFSGDKTGLSKGIAHMKALSDALKSITEATAPFSAEKPVVAVYITDSFGHAATGDTVLHYLITSAGAVNAAGSGKEWIADKDMLSKADVVFCPDQLTENIKVMANLANSPAIKNGRVYGIQAAAMERQSQRMIDAVKVMAQKMYPDAIAATTGQPSQTSMR